MMDDIFKPHFGTAGIILNESEARMFGYSEESIEKAKSDSYGVLRSTDKLPRAFLSKLIPATYEKKIYPESYNRADLRYLNRRNPACSVCKIHWNERFDYWNACTIKFSEDSPAPGHRFFS